MDAQVVIAFWFEELKPADWWKKSDALDAKIAQRFAALHKQACDDKLTDWRNSSEGSLAEIILLDQFSRNIFRDQALAFEQDQQALQLAQQAITKGFDQALPAHKRAFIYMPLMHSESLSIQQQSLTLFSQVGLEANLRSAKHHKMIIQRFGRYPHRNVILGRESTAEEQEFLQQPGSSF